MNLNSFIIFEEPKMEKLGESYKVKREWKDRLFSRPWNPFKSHNTIVPMVPMDTILKTGNKLIMHPEIAKRLRDESRIKSINI